jgi:hypothetical protein
VIISTMNDLPGYTTGMAKMLIERREQARARMP